MRAWLTRPTAASILTILLTAITGCGNSTPTTQGSSTPTGTTSANVPSSLTASIEAICARRNNKIAAFNLKVESEARFKTVAHQIAAAEQTTLTELAKLNTPAATQTSWQQFLNDRRALIKAWRKVSTQGLYDGLPTSINRKTNMTTVVTTQKTLLTTAQHDNYKNCTQPD